MAITIPTSGDATTQKAFRDLQQQINDLQKAVDAKADQTAVDALKAAPPAQPVTPSISVSDPNLIVRGAGGSHAPGLVPDPGPYDGLGDQLVLHSNGNFQRVLNGVIQAVPYTLSSLDSKTQAAVVNGCLYVLSKLQTGGLLVNGGPGSIRFKQWSPNAYPLFIRAAGGGSGVAGVQPNTISGLQGWWKGDVGVFSDAGTTPCVDGNGIYQWNDQSGNARNLTQTVAGNRPVYKTAIVNGNPIARFTSASPSYFNGAAVSNFFAVGAKTAFVVYQHTANASTTLWADASTKIAQVLDSTGTALRAYNDDGAADNASKSGLISGSWYVGTLLHSGGTLYSGANDTRTASLTGTASGNTSSLTGALLVGMQTGSVNPISGDIAEMLFYNAALSEADRQGIEAYLSRKYNIALGYAVASDSNVDLLRIEDASGNPFFRVTNIGDVYVGATKLTVP